MSRALWIGFAATVGICLLAPAPVGAAEWLARPIDDVLRIAADEGKPVLVYVYYSRPGRTETERKTEAQRDSELLDSAFFGTAAFEGLASNFVLVRINSSNNDTICTRFGAPRRSPCVMFLEPGSGELIAHLTALPDDGDPGKTQRLYADGLGRALQIRAMTAEGRTPQTAAENLLLGDLYAQSAMYKRAMPWFEAAVQSGVAPADDRRVRMMLAYLCGASYKAAESIAHLNQSLRGLSARPPEDGDPDLWWPARSRCEPIALVAANGYRMGVIYKCGSVPEFSELIGRLERMVHQYAQPNDVTPAEAFEFANVYFELENAEGALPFYARVARAGGEGVTAAQLEAAVAGVGLCRVHLGDHENAMRDLSAYLQRYTKVRTTLLEDEIDHRPWVLLVVAGLHYAAGDERMAEKLLQQVMDEYEGTDSDHRAAEADLLLQDIRGRRGG